MADPLIVDQPQGGAGDQQWREWPGAVRIADPLIVWELYGETDPTQWRERPWSRPDRRSAHCVGVLCGEGSHTMERTALELPRSPIRSLCAKAMGGRLAHNEGNGVAERVSQALTT
jgi:hypothetical protein